MNFSLKTYIKMFMMHVIITYKLNTKHQHMSHVQEGQVDFLTYNIPTIRGTDNFF